MEKVNNCPICNNPSFNTFLECKDYTTSGELFLLQKCSSCEFVFTSPRPDRKQIVKYYESRNYISHTGDGKKIIDKLYLLARKKALRSKFHLVKKKSSGNKILDYGCGTGEFLKFLSSNNYSTFGVEPSAIAREKAINLMAGEIRKDITEIQEAGFDVITLWHVLEHLHDLKQSLQTFRNLLKQNGTIFIAVPNLKSLDAKLYHSFWAGYDVPRHLWHFNQKDMRTLLETNGFRLLEVLPMKLDSFYVSLLSESYKNPKKGTLIRMFNAFLTGLRSNQSARKTLDYSSLIYIARK